MKRGAGRGTTISLSRIASSDALRAIQMQPDFVTCKKLKLKGFVAERLIGKGAFASVYECRKNTVKKKYAAKVVAFQDNKALKWETENEIEILKELNTHRHVVRLHTVLRDADSTIQILEYIPGCTFYDGILKWPQFKENSLKNIFKQLLSALNYCHERRIVHRDICPENIMWFQLPTARKPHQSPVLRLIDFNLARRLPEHSSVLRADPLGNPSYMAPECLLDSPVVSTSTDIWSLGVIAYTLMAGYPPFWNNNYNHLLANISEANYVFPDHLWKHVPKEAIDFIKTTLCKEMDERLRANELLRSSKWLHHTDGCHGNSVWAGHNRLQIFLKNLNEMRNRRSHRIYSLKLEERKAFVPDDNMIGSLPTDENNNNVMEEGRDLSKVDYCHW